ncbi:hypothetical protein AIOL_004699 [Candidatus Rhodobacter oscarellae]|uniref:Uncharacterized protein n=1 Tax=Candidatus Rhodobacter oscarellae TaxID=1675527 RepID=A0A0J9EAS2_9RHOB|nr:hypothetical protein [Candidatus Rhodobacter lobularis]KMW59716.1 hypothetical protein AIOL_004699 [Candidatus Rhodobacter lobularis]
MKKLILTGAFALLATSAFSGGLHDPVVAPDVVVVDAVESAGSDEWVGVLMTFLTIIYLGVGG